MIFYGVKSRTIDPKVDKDASIRASQICHKNSLHAEPLIGCLQENNA
jgi:hypothetical protein